jgi:23S rRNA pseudouridine1911/1915/1917 synthase
MESLFEVVFEDDRLLVINKPAGLVCHPTKTDAYSSLIGRVRLHIGPEIHPHLINRLDRETSGIIIVAKQDEVARELRRQWEGRLVCKDYLAIVHGHVGPDAGEIDASLGKDESSRVAIKDCVRQDGAPAQTRYKVLERFDRTLSNGVTKPFSLLQVQPRTGRKHQIRIHLAYLGHPIVGDKIYGSDEDAYLALVEDRMTAAQREELILPHHALHASAVSFTLAAGPARYEARPEPWFREFAGTRGLT